MVVESEVPKFWEWVPAATGNWLLVLLVFGCVAAVFGLAVSVLRNGPVEGLVSAVNLVTGALRELIALSPRRIWALARLAVQESLHRRVLVVFGVFLLLLLFAGWYIDPTTTDLPKLYLSFVLTATSYLVLLLVLFLSVFSLPSDINSRTIFTVVTKPVRYSELVLGRMLGFAIVGTVILAVTGAISYVFVLRGLSHTHEVVEASWVEVEPDDSADPVVRRGETARMQNHRHQVLLTESGKGRTDYEAGHWHDVWTEERGGRTVYVTGPPRDQLTARVPVYGKLRFRDSGGRLTDKGVNVGNEWTYRSYIAGGTLATAVWTFEGVTPEVFGDELPVEMTLSVFRTYKGDIVTGILGSIVLRNPDRPEIAAAPRNFLAREYSTDEQVFPRKLVDADGRPLDLFDDLAPGGRLQVEISCLEPSQYYGMAQADVYLRAGDAPFFLNFIKGYVGIWQQMLLVIGVGVMFSTFLNSAVALLATAGMLLAGFFSDFVSQLAENQLEGGGPVESLYRMLTQMNLVTEIDPGPTRTFIESYDTVLRFGLRQLSYVLPDFTSFNDAAYVANGFNIPVDSLWIHMATVVAFLIPIFVASYFLLKTREVAR